MSKPNTIWATFHSHGQGDTSPPSITSAVFVQALWQGTPGEYPIRATVWKLGRESLGLGSSTPIRPNPKGQQKVQDKVQMELNSEGCFAQIGVPVDSALVQKLLLSHAQKIALDDYMPGSAQLAALMLVEVHNDTGAVLDTLVALSFQTESYFSNSYVELRRDCLVLAELIVADLPTLADHLNSVAFDVVDLTDLVCVWAAAIFVYSFPKTFVLRMIDLILLLGTSVILPVMFGFFKFFASDISVLHSIDSVFDFLSTVPGTLTPADLDSIFRAAFELALRQERLEAMRSEKDWIKTADHEGVPTFVPGLFTEKPEHAPSTSVVRYLSARFESGNAVDLPTTLPVSRLRPSGSSDNTKFDGGATTSESMHAKLTTAESMIRTQHAKIDRLEKQILILEAKVSASVVPVTPSRCSSPKYGAKHALVKELQSKQTFNPESSFSSVAIHVDPQNQERFRSFSFTQMNEVFSKVHSLLDFPCVYMEGYLMKLSRAGLFGRQVLNQRWFVLKGRYLTYYKSADHSKPQKDRCMNLWGAHVAAVDVHPKGDFAFTITLEQDQYLLFASSEQVRTKWLTALE